MPGKQFLKITALALGLASAAPVLSQVQAPQDDESDLPSLTLQELASHADLIALVQVLDTDYAYQREFPIGGTAFLRVLIPYKVNRPVPDIIEVYEEGLHEHECYFPNPPPTEEGRRYLLMVRDNPDVEGQFLSLDQGCSLTVLVKRDNSYALRYPLEGIATSESVAELAVPMDFSDRHAVLDYEALSVDERLSLLEGGYVDEREDRFYKLTHGVPLSAFRRLIGEENLTRDRALLRPAPDPYDP